VATKTSGEIEKEFIDNLKNSTGKTLTDWMKQISGSGINKRNDIIKWLKEKNGFGHMNASLLTGMYLNNGKPVYGSTEDLLDNQFAKAAEMKPLYEAFTAFARKHFPNSTVLPKKTYVSILEKREFAAINIKPTELRIGFDLGDHAWASGNDGGDDPFGNGDRHGDGNGRHQRDDWRDNSGGGPRGERALDRRGGERDPPGRPDPASLQARPGSLLPALRVQPRSRRQGSERRRVPGPDLDGGKDGGGIQGAAGGLREKERRAAPRDEPAQERQRQADHVSGLAAGRSAGPDDPV
jgi:hypothetical protein